MRGRCKEGWRGVNVRGWRRREGRRAMRVGVKGGRQNYLWVFGIGRRCRRRKVLRGQLVVQRLRRRLNRRNDGSLATIPWFLWINLSENFFPQSSDHWRVEKCPTSCPTPSSLGFNRFDCSRSTSVNVGVASGLSRLTSKAVRGSGGKAWLSGDGRGTSLDGERMGDGN